MANYTYRETNYSGTDGWIDKLEHIDPTSSADSNYQDIHFTKPKKVLASTATHPHVTFQKTSGLSDHWFIKNEHGQWVFETQGKSGPGLAKRQKIANKVLADALALNWIRAAPKGKVVSKDGFRTVESKQGRKWRMQTSF